MEQGEGSAAAGAAGAAVPGAAAVLPVEGWAGQPRRQVASCSRSAPLCSPALCRQAPLESPTPAASCHAPDRPEPCRSAAGLRYDRAGSSSRRPRRFGGLQAPVAQRIELLSSKQQVAGSSPARGTTNPQLRATAFGLLAHSYNTASSVLRRLGDNGLAMIAADRAVQAARTVGEPLLLAASAYRLANVFLPAGRTVEAKEVALSAASSLESSLDTSTTHLATWGSLLLTAAIAAAQQNDAREAWELVGEAKAAARRLETDHADLNTIFGPASVAIQGVQVAAELGDGREVLRRAKSVEPTRLPPHLVERRSHFLIDVARGHAHRADDPAALATLLQAERLAPEEVRYNPIASDLVMVLLKRERRAPTPGLHDLSARIGVGA